MSQRKSARCAVAGPLILQASNAPEGAGDRPLDASERAELERLSKENADLRLDRSFLKKPRPSSPPIRPVEMFALIEAEKTNFTITRMIALLKVS